jgi:hypothetical protein
MSHPEFWWNPKFGIFYPFYRTPNKAETVQTKDLKKEKSHPEF